MTCQLVSVTAILGPSVAVLGRSIEANSMSSEDSELGERQDGYIDKLYCGLRQSFGLGPIVFHQEFLDLFSMRGRLLFSRAKNERITVINGKVRSVLIVKDNEFGIIEREIENYKAYGSDEEIWHCAIVEQAIARGKKHPQSGLLIGVKLLGTYLTDQEIGLISKEVPSWISEI